MQTYIVHYAHIFNNDWKNAFDIKTARILSNLTKKEVELEFAKRCDEANANMME